MIIKPKTEPQVDPIRCCILGVCCKDDMAARVSAMTAELCNIGISEDAANKVAEHVFSNYRLAAV